MLEFSPFSMSMLKKAQPYLQKSTALCSDFSAGFIFMWHKGSDLHFCFWHDTLVLRQTFGDRQVFSYPIGADPDGMIDELLLYTFAHRIPLWFYAVSDRLLETIRADERLQSSTCTYDRRWSDYLYSFEEIMRLRGKKYSGQRNHIHKFERLYGEPEIRFIRPDDRPLIDRMLDRYAAEHSDADTMELFELQQTRRLLDAYENLHLHAACIIADGQIAAFSIGEIIGDMLVIHVEKALRQYEGIYPTMFNGFVRLLADTLDEVPQWINREDDSGDPGLRMSKMQYHPIRMVDKYVVHVYTFPMSCSRAASQ